MLCLRLLGAGALALITTMPVLAQGIACSHPQRTMLETLVKEPSRTWRSWFPRRKRWKTGSRPSSAPTGALQAAIGRRGHAAGVCLVL